MSFSPRYEVEKMWQHVFFDLKHCRKPNIDFSCVYDSFRESKRVSHCDGTGQMQGKRLVVEQFSDYLIGQ